MQLASHGARHVSNAVPRGIGVGTSGAAANARSIHIPAFARPIADMFTSSARGTTKNLFNTSRHLLTRFFAHLTAPGLNALPSSSPLAFPASWRGAQRSIHSSFSLSMQQSVSRPLGAPHLPRAPAVPRPHCPTHVGLGTARNFHSGRALFQNVVENVPVAGRAFWEADWEIKMRQDREGLKTKTAQNKKKDREEGLKYKVPDFKKIEKENRISIEADAKTAYEAEMERYFPAFSVPSVTTHLLIPLAPTPTERLPLPPDIPSTKSTLLPLEALGSLHAKHSTHAIRVASLFARLDSADVWARGAACSAHGEVASLVGNAGVCTVLRVEFVGWTEKEVRDVIGEAGTGWCVLEEVGEEDSLVSEVVSEMLSDNEYEASEVESDAVPARMDDKIEGIDPAKSFVMPSLDFSSAFIGSSSPSVSPSYSMHSSVSDLHSNSEWDMDVQSGPDMDFSVGSFLPSPGSGSSSRQDSPHWDDIDLLSGPSSVASPSFFSSPTASRIGFSYAFAGRLDSSEGSSHVQVAHTQERMF